jgi:hypothetical protein
MVFVAKAAHVRVCCMPVAVDFERTPAQARHALSVAEADDLAFRLYILSQAAAMLVRGSQSGSVLPPSGRSEVVSSSFCPLGLLVRLETLCLLRLHSVHLPLLSLATFLAWASSRSR